MPIVLFFQGMGIPDETFFHALFDPRACVHAVPDALLRRAMALSHDGEYHFKDECNALLVEILLEHVHSRYDTGAWSTENSGI